MPLTKTITNADALRGLSIINPPIYQQACQALAAGRRVEERLSVFNDPGEDWGEILVDGTVIARWSGY